MLTAGFARENKGDAGAGLGSGTGLLFLLYSCWVTCEEKWVGNCVALLVLLVGC